VRERERKRASERERERKREGERERREAYRLFREAELLEAEGDVDGATRLYRRVARLSPSLAEIYCL
jgi:hypothetical protein